jgi:hypothetical protein
MREPFYNILPLSILASFDPFYNSDKYNENDVIYPLALQNHIISTLSSNNNIQRYVFKINDKLFNPCDVYDTNGKEFAGNNVIFVHDNIYTEFAATNSLAIPTITLLYNLQDVKQITLKKKDKNKSDPLFNDLMTILLENIKFVQIGQLLNVANNTFEIINIILSKDVTQKQASLRLNEIRKQLELNSLILGKEVGINSCPFIINDCAWHFANKDLTICGCVTGQHINEVEIDFVEEEQYDEYNVYDNSHIQNVQNENINKKVTPNINVNYDVKRFPGVGRRLGSKYEN